MRLLVVEDDRLLGDALQVGLKQAGFAADWVVDGVAAEAALDGEPFAAVVLDIGLPRRTGLEVLKRLRQRGSKVPVIILTARDAIDDRIGGLDAGADDYLVKPVDLGELAARLRALLRRAGGSAMPLLRASGIELDPAAHTVRVDGVPVDMPAREFALLHALMQSAGRVLSKTQLEQQLYSWGDEVESNTVEVYIHHLRRRIGAERIRTLRGVGYLLPRDGHGVGDVVRDGGGA